jgi:hypothetical protein
MIDPVDDPLAERLRSMTITVPAGLVPGAMARARVAGRVPGRSLRRLRIGGVAAAVFVCLVVAASYFAPRFGEALAATPFVGGPIGRLLQSAGLVRVAGQLTNLNDTAVSAGHRVHLVGGYADSLQTVLILRFDDPQASGGAGSRLTDQFGRTYDGKVEFDQPVAGGTEEAILFEPVQWPASWVGARLTLEMDQISLQSTSPMTQVNGKWMLHATLADQDARKLATPAPGRLGGTVVRFNSVRASSIAVEVQAVVVGPAAAQVSDVGHIRLPFCTGTRNLPCEPAQPGLSIELVDPAGMADFTLPGTETIGGNRSVVDLLWITPIKGRYQIVVSLKGTGSFTRTITVS